MGYEIHIERTPAPTLDDWKAAVGETDGVRLNSAPAYATNPRTGEVISLDGADGDAEVYLDGRWIPCFRWSNEGLVDFRATTDFDDPGSQLRTIARALAHRLNAVVRGDEGEYYD